LKELNTIVIVDGSNNAGVWGHRSSGVATVFAARGGLKNAAPIFAVKIFLKHEIVRQW